MLTTQDFANSDLRRQASTVASFCIVVEFCEYWACPQAEADLREDL